MSAPYRDEFRTVNGCRLHYQDWGDLDAPVLLMVHGLSQQSHTFDAVAERLHARFRCIALDVRGRGESEWADPRTYNHRTYVEDILGLMQALDVPRWHYMGTSMGGQIAMMAAARRPEVFTSVVLNDIGPELDPRGGARITQYMQTVPKSFPDFDAALDWAVAQYPWLQGVPRKTVAGSVRWAVREADDGTWRFRFDPAIIQNAPADPAMLKKAAEIMWQGLEALRGPVLLVRGVDTDVLAADTAARMAQVQPRLTRVDVPGIGHAPTLAEPVVLEALDGFYV